VFAKEKKEEGNKEEAKEEKKVEEKKDESKEEPPPEIVLKVDMHCEACARKVAKALKGFQGHFSLHFSCIMFVNDLTSNYENAPMRNAAIAS